jgi:hypothetical protein
VSIWSEVFLGVIALATLAMAVVLVGALVAASRLARRVARLLDQLDTELKTLLDHLNAVGRDASRAAALAAGQVERVDRALTDVAARAEQTLHRLQQTLATPAREGRALISALAVALGAMRGVRMRRSRAEDEDALFI